MSHVHGLDLGTVKQLFNEILDLKIRCRMKRDRLVGLWTIYGERAVLWSSIDRSPKVDPTRKLTV